MSDENTRPAPEPRRQPAGESDSSDATAGGAPASPSRRADASAIGESHGADAGEGRGATGDAARGRARSPRAGSRADARMSDEPGAEPNPQAGAGAQRSDAFAWHPDHRGKSVDEVRAALAQEIASDQRQHRLAMDGAEESEHEALASVVGLERKWGQYDFDWAEQEPEHLADRIVEFERERERRRELISWSDYRSASAGAAESHAPGERAPELSTSAKGLSLLLVVLLITVILVAVWAL